jgi:hypothetical protein
MDSIIRCDRSSDLRFFLLPDEAEERPVFDVVWSQRQITIHYDSHYVSFAMEEAPCCPLGEFCLTFDVLQWQTATR